jgi:hypothetical protein
MLKIPIEAAMFLIVSPNAFPAQLLEAILCTTRCGKGISIPC